MIAIKKVNRRGFLKTGIGAAAGLTLSFTLPEKSRLHAQAAERQFPLNGYIHIGADDSVTMVLPKSEMGQGPMTALSQILADELDCDWAKVHAVFAPVNPKLYGPMQGTFGSMSVRTGWGPMRKAGATARAMLVEAAASQWNIDKAQCQTEDGAVIAAGRRASYGSLVEAAAKLSPPNGIAPKDPSSFKYIGKSLKRLDTPLKVNGTAEFGIDAKVPGMQYAVVARCPVIGGKVASFDDSKAKTVPGIKQVVQISRGVAVIADNTWNAMEGRRALEIKWDEGSLANLDSAGIRTMMQEQASKPGAVARKQGDGSAALASAAKKIEAVYEAAYMSHAPMEPMNCTAHVRADGCDVWAATQIQTAAQQTAMQITGLPADKVNIHTLYLGGGFGRRGGADFIEEAVETSKAAGIPVKLTWSREDDMMHDMYRPASYTRFAGGVDAEGWPYVWTTSVACPSFAGMRNGVDFAAVQGINDIAYEIPHIQVEYNKADPGIPTTYWRSVGYSQNTFFTESFLDELAAAGGKDPLELRLRLLAKTPRMRAVVELAAEKAGWGKRLPAGRAQGISVVNNIGSFNAQVAEVSIDKGKLKVHRVVCAVDCGHVVNPAIVEAQIQSGIVYGLSAAIKGGITIKNGRVEQTNFDKFEVLRIDEMPVVEVYIVPSTQAPGGIGEASTPSTAPAVANAIFALTGKRLRRLPIRREDLA